MIPKPYRLLVKCLQQGIDLGMSRTDNLEEMKLEILHAIEIELDEWFNFEAEINPRKRHQNLARLQPIESAPRDGLLILLCRQTPGMPYSEYMVGFWCQTLEHWMHQRHDDIWEKSRPTYWAFLPELPLTSFEVKK